MNAAFMERLILPRISQSPNYIGEEPPCDPAARLRRNGSLSLSSSEASPPHTFTLSQQRPGHLQFLQRNSPAYFGTPKWPRGCRVTQLEPDWTRMPTRLRHEHHAIGAGPASAPRLGSAARPGPPHDSRPAARSEERRVGKECRFRWSPDE